MNRENPKGRIDLLPRDYFLNQLRIEKRRADRSKNPLSVALFYINHGVERSEASLQEFLTLFLKKTRETDIKGWVDHNVIGIILPDTDERGMKNCIQKIAHANGDISYSVISGTYPSHLFEQLLSEKEGRPDFFPLDLEEQTRSHGLGDVIKRGMDIVGSVIGLLLFSPIMLLTALAVKITSPGPIIFRQARLGLKGTRFQFYKFRSMYWNVDDHIHREYVANLIEGNLDKINEGHNDEPLYKMKSDSRVTLIGRFIRKTSIDELPQFFNVLKGDMSLVGPRPPLPYEVERYKPWHLRRILEVKPGITGLWQVDGRSRTSFDDMVRMDLRYVQNRSLWLDLMILLKTVRAVVRPKGAL